CKTCQSTVEIKRKPNSYLFIDTEFFFQQNETRYSGVTMLSNIPEKIVINNEIYVLSGIVRNIPGHFTAFCRNTAGVRAEHDDMSRKLRTIKNPHVTKGYMII
ncbi:120.7 kDa protein in NOF-FB transposable element, partial [Camponotus floridanus]